MNKTYIKKSPINGLGVFASIDIEVDDLVETAPFLVFTGKTPKELVDYEFEYNENSKLICLGHVAMYNHSSNPNLEYLTSTDIDRCLDFISMRDIKKDEEVFIDYEPDWWADRNVKPNEVKATAKPE